MRIKQMTKKNYSINIMTVQECLSKISFCENEIPKLKKALPGLEIKSLEEWNTFKKLNFTRNYKMQIDIDSGELETVKEVVYFCITNGIDAANIDNFEICEYSSFFRVNSIPYVVYTETAEEFEQRKRIEQNKGDIWIVIAYIRYVDEQIENHDKPIRGLETYLMQLKKKLKYLNDNNLERG